MLTIAASSASQGASFFVLESGLTLLAVLVAWLLPEFGATSLIRLESFYTRLARKRTVVCVTVGITALALRLLILPAVPIPEPFIHDEFSFLLAADTFASGRLTNTTHPLWVFFETFHVTHIPTYMSMYFPAQGILLAAGKAVLGHPWYGAWLGGGLLCAAIAWMLQGWLPPSWALLGSAIAVCRLGLFSYWVNSYYGGAVAGIGGALVLGSLPRLIRAPRTGYGVAAAVGCILLANSRPYEGLLVCASAVAILTWAAARQRRMDRRRLAAGLAAPLILLLLAAGGMAFYNFRLFGDATTPPYQVNRTTYASAPVFLWQAPRPEPQYRHKLMRDFYTHWEMADFLYIRTFSGFWKQSAQKFWTVVFFFFGVVFLVPLLMLPRVLRDRRTKLLLIVGAVFGVGLSVNAWLFPHYAAPFTGALYVILMQCMRHLRCWTPGDRPIGVALVRVLPVLCLLLVGLRVAAEPLRLTTPRWPSMWYGTERLGLPRARASREFERLPGTHLAIVRYAPTHAPFDDWVYNSADIDSSKVVWAREMDAVSTRALLKYYRKRKAWLIEPDFDPPRISLFPTKKDEMGWNE